MKLIVLAVVWTVLLAVFSFINLMIVTRSTVEPMESDVASTLTVESVQAVPTTNDLVAAFTPNAQTAGCISFSHHIPPYTDRTIIPPAEWTFYLLSVVKSQTLHRCIILYNIYPEILEQAKKLDMKALSIISLSSNATTNQAGIEAAISLAQAYPETLLGISCGNELAKYGITDAVISITRNCIFSLRARGVSHPIGVMDTLKTYNTGWFAIQDYVDFMGVNIYPWFDNAGGCLKANIAANQTMRRYIATKDRYYKPIIMTEAGWPGFENDSSLLYGTIAGGCGVANNINQVAVVTEIVNLFRQSGYPMSTFQAFRNPTKGYGSTLYENYWGICPQQPSGIYVCLNVYNGIPGLDTIVPSLNLPYVPPTTIAPSTSTPTATSVDTVAPTEVTSTMADTIAPTVTITDVLYTETASATSYDTISPVTHEPSTEINSYTTQSVDTTTWPEGTNAGIFFGVQTTDTPTPNVLDSTSTTVPTSIVSTTIEPSSTAVPTTAAAATSTPTVLPTTSPTPTYAPTTTLLSTTTTQTPTTTSVPTTTQAPTTTAVLATRGVTTTTQRPTTAAPSTTQVSTTTTRAPTTRTPTTTLVQRTTTRTPTTAPPATTRTPTTTVRPSTTKPPTTTARVTTTRTPATTRVVTTTRAPTTTTRAPTTTTRAPTTKVPTTTQKPKTCVDSSWKLNGAICYKLNIQKISWTAARSACASIGAKLAVYPNLSENNFALTVNPSYDQRVWIGYSVTSSKITDVDGKSPAFVNWANTPDANGCVFQVRDADKATTGKWKTAPCTNLNMYMCMRNAQ